MTYQRVPRRPSAVLEGSVAIGIEVSALKEIFFSVVPFPEFYLQEIMRGLTGGRRQKDALRLLIRAKHWKLPKPSTKGDWFINREHPCSGVLRSHSDGVFKKYFLISYIKRREGKSVSTCCIKWVISIMS